MQKRKRGQGLAVSAIGFGCMGLNFGYGTSLEKKDAVAMVRAAYEHGLTLFDTAEVYSRRYCAQGDAKIQAVKGFASIPALMINWLCFSPCV